MGKCKSPTNIREEDSRHKEGAQKPEAGGELGTFELGKEDPPTQCGWGTVSNRRGQGCPDPGPHTPE